MLFQKLTILLPQRNFWFEPHPSGIPVLVYNVLINSTGHEVTYMYNKKKQLKKKLKNIFFEHDTLLTTKFNLPIKTLLNLSFIWETHTVYMCEHIQSFTIRIVKAQSYNVMNN